MKSAGLVRALSNFLKATALLRPQVTPDPRPHGHSQGEIPSSASLTRMGWAGSWTTALAAGEKEPKPFTRKELDVPDATSRFNWTDENVRAV